MSFESINWDAVQEASSGERLPAGGYVAKILAVEDVADKQYLRFSYDIAEGAYAGYFTRQYKERKERFGDAKWGGTFVRSYKDRATPFMKAFITSVEKSNGIKFTGRTQDFKNQLVGIILRDEEYLANNGDYRWSAKFDSAHDAEKIRSGEFEAPAPKSIQHLSDIGKKPSAAFFTDDSSDDGELPF